MKRCEGQEPSVKTSLAEKMNTVVLKPPKKGGTSQDINDWRKAKNH
jgi:hypothetical protein